MCQLQEHKEKSEEKTPKMCGSGPSDANEKMDRWDLQKRNVFAGETFIKTHVTKILLVSSNKTV